MSEWTAKHVTIVGVGLLGGSAGLALHAIDESIHVAGVGRRRSSLDEALEVGAIDSAHLDIAEAAERTDLVILATPVGAFEAYLAALRDVLPDGAVITDVGSTKAHVVAAARRVLPAGKNGRAFVGSHPMAGSERRGPAYARADLFDGATCVVTPEPDADEALVGKIESLWRRFGMRVVRMSPEAHDRAAARVSHLPHALAGLLMMLPDEEDLSISATGFRDATRLAGGHPEMWRDIFATNREAVLDALERFGRSLAEFTRLVAAGDDDAVEALLAEARDRRDDALAGDPPTRRVALE